MTPDSAKGPPSAEPTQALQYLSEPRISGQGTGQERKQEATTKARVSYGRTTAP